VEVVVALALAPTTIVTVTVNPCLDVEKDIDAEDLAGATYRPVASRESPGGKGIDVSRAIKAVRSLVSSGPTSIATGFIGGFTGELIQGLLRIEDINADFVDIGNETRTNVILHLLRSGREIRLNSPGPQITGRDYRNLLTKIDSLTKKQGVTAAAICGSICVGMQVADSYNQILAAFKANGSQCSTYLDTGHVHTVNALQSQFPPDYIKPNIEEFFRLAIAAGLEGDNLNEEKLQEKYCTITSRDNLENNWRALLNTYQKMCERFPSTKILLSLSRFGALVKDVESEDFLHCYYPVDVKPKTFVGAGDSFLGGFMVALSQERYGRSLEIPLRAGVAASIARLSGEHETFGYIDVSQLRKITADNKLKVVRFRSADLSTHLEKLISDFGSI
jgi:fructose-1-phosphate kinase PfkB-like protein